MKVYTLDTRESGTRVRAQSPPLCNVNRDNVQNIEIELRNELIICDTSEVYI